MRFFITAGLLSLVGLVAARSCAQADRFGDPTVTPTTGLHIGDTITVNVDLTCAVQNFGNDATSLDYSIEIPATSTTAEETVFLGEHAIAAGALSDTLTTTIPQADFVSGQTYNLVFRNNFVNNGVASNGGVLVPLIFA